jgi:hypothetical protein
MTRKIPILIFAAALSCASCQQSKMAVLKEQNQKAESSEHFTTHLEETRGRQTTDSVRLTFTVVNNTDTLQRFCKWETPFEPHLGKYLEVIDDKGTEATFIGATARRVMPPAPESYINVPPHDSVSTNFDVAKNYSIRRESGYTVKYIGGGISELPASNKLKITVAKL